jgi:hypothetical protein
MVVIIRTPLSGLTVVAGGTPTDAESAAPLALLAESRDDDS